MTSPAGPVTTMRNVPLFAALREGDLEYLGRMLRPQSYPKNRIILFAHDPCEAFYVLLSGQVKVLLVVEDGREVILSLRGAGDFFGEAALLDNEPPSASVIAMEDSRLLVLRRDDFHRCIMQMPGVAFGLLRGLYGRLREADQKIGGLMLLDVTGRVCHLLLQLADREGGEQVIRPPTHQIIAQMVGSSRETVSRTVRELADQDLIEVSRGKLGIKNRKALEVAAGRLAGKPVRRRDTPVQQRSPVTYPDLGSAP